LFLELVLDPSGGTVLYGQGVVVTQLMEMAEQRQLERTLKQLERQDILILDELGYPGVLCLTVYRGHVQTAHQDYCQKYR